MLKFLLPMKKQSFALTFIGSITLGWLTRSGVSAVNVMPVAKTSLTQPERTSRIDQTKNTREAEFKTFIKRVPTLSDEDRVAFSKNLAPQDRAILIENLLDEGDPSGNSYDFDLMIDSIIEIWATEDFEGAWVWTQKLAKDSYRRSISGQLINILEKKDPNRALALFSEVGADGYFIPTEVPQLALIAATRRNASDFIELLGKLPVHKSGMTLANPDCEFAKDFDFQQAVKGATAMAESRKQFPNIFPSNFIKAWAERDPDAAFACLADNLKFFPCHFDGLLDGVEKNSAQSMPTWVVGKMAESETYRKIIVEEISFLNSANCISGILEAMTDSANRDRFLTDVAISASKYSNLDFTKTFSEMSSPQVRLEALSKIKIVGWHVSERISEEQYQAWGVTKQQVVALVPTNKEN
jgi:hypothetical protein